MVKFVLKAGKEVLEVHHEQGESFEDFQAKVYTLTDIPPKNLKVLFKAKLIKDNQTLFAVPEGAQLIAMGTRTGKQLKKGEAVMSEAVAEQMPAVPTRYGLANIGNTCYINAAIQMLRSVPEFVSLLKQRTDKAQNNANADQMLLRELKRTIEELQVKDVTPKQFVGMFLQTHHDYLPLGKQHDSDEFMQQVLAGIARESPEAEKGLRDCFQIGFVDKLTNIDIPAEGVIETHNRSLKICCSLGGVQKDLKIGTLQEGIKLSLETRIEKLSPVDGLNHIYEKKTRFESLPPYIFVQMVRFFWKKADDLPHSKPIASKICKTIDFGARLDLFEFCSETLKVQLAQGRDAIEQNKLQEEQQYKKQYEAYREGLGETNRPETRIIADFKEKWKQRQKRLTEGLETGIYELMAVVTHLGNSIESGHYMAWVKETEEEWSKYDDETVFPMPSEKVIQLRGGQPNLEIAYVLLYRKVYSRPSS